MGKERIQEILSTIQQIKDSEQSVNIYFRTRSTVPFSKAQYYNYLKRLKDSDSEGKRIKKTGERSARYWTHVPLSSSSLAANNRAKLEKLDLNFYF